MTQRFKAIFWVELALIPIIIISGIFYINYQKDNSYTKFCQSKGYDYYSLSDYMGYIECTKIIYNNQTHQINKITHTYVLNG